MKRWIDDWLAGWLITIIMLAQAVIQDEKVLKCTVGKLETQEY